MHLVVKSLVDALLGPRLGLGDCLYVFHRIALTGEKDHGAEALLGEIGTLVKKGRVCTADAGEGWVLVHEQGYKCNS